jgi:hypothetical protein
VNPGAAGKSDRFAGNPQANRSVEIHMTDIDYVFGTGDGDVHAWSSPADLDLSGTGVCDAVRLDFDGSGSPDDALWDSDGDGVADVAVLDLDGDGVLDHFFTDPSGLGTWDQQIWPTDIEPGDQATVG